MSDWIIGRIARTLTEDENPLADFHNEWESKSVLSDDTYFQVIRILKDVVENNDCILDHRKLAVEFIPPGFIIKDIWIDCPNPETKRSLVERLAEQTGDESIKHTFDNNLRVNLYTAMSGEFGDRVRDELNLNIAHQFKALPPGSDRTDRAEVLPMATIMTPNMETEEEEEMEDLGLGMEEEPEPELGEVEIPGFETEDEEMAAPELGAEEELPELSGEEELVSFEDIDKIANLIEPI